MPQAVRRNQEPTADADIDDGAVLERLSDGERDATNPADEEEHERDHPARHRRQPRAQQQGKRH